MYKAPGTRVRFSALILTPLMPVVISLPASAAVLDQASLPPCASGSSVGISRLSTTLPRAGAEQSVEVGGSVLSAMEAEVAISRVSVTVAATAIGRRAGQDYIVTIPAGALPAPVYGGGIYSVMYPVPQAAFRYVRETKDRRGLSKPDIALFLDPNNASAFSAHLSFGLSSQDVALSDAQFQVEKCLRPLKRGFKRELLYSGGGKGSIRLQYREYMNDFARPAFSQELSYDLAEGNEIGFKGARIKIIEVSNIGLRYAVLKPFAD